MMQKMESCYRCGERKEVERFRPGQNYWNRLCIRCELSPSGAMPIRETDEHWTLEVASGQTNLPTTKPTNPQ
ncbi:protein NinD [Ewingella sp. CoE-038-23]|uniref:protein NinD n=1 Tax=Ewingella docleensis TaxID=3118588 RepID=UPI0033653347